MKSGGQEGTNKARPKVLKGKHVTFEPTNPRVRLDWGTGKHRSGTLAVYRTEDCKGIHAAIVDTEGMRGIAIVISRCRGGYAGGIP